MAVHFKFKSAKDYASVPIEGHFISIASLKEKIFEKMKLSRACDFDLLIANAQTNEEYTEGFLVPENTSVLVRRVPGNPCWPILTDHQNEQHYEGSSKSKAAETVVIELDKHVSKPETAASMDDFGVDLYEEPDDHTQVVSSLIKADEDDKIKAFIDASESDWQRQTDASGSGGHSKNGFGKGFVNGSQWKSPPQGYVCFRCGVAGHFIHFCPTNGDPTFNTKKIKQPTGIPKTMLEANPDGSYALPNGEIAIMKPNEDIFEKEIHSSPATRILGDIPAEFLCALCHNVLHDAVLTSKCCCKSYCDRCIRSEIINKGCCSCGANNVLADDLLPNRTLREAIQRLVESKANNSEPSHAKVQVEDSPRVHQKTEDIHTFSRTNGNFAHKINDNKRTFGGPAKTRGVFTKHWMRGQATYGRQTMGFNRRGYHRTQRRGMPFSGGMSYNKDAFLCTGFWPGSQYVGERMPAYGNPHKGFRSGDNDIPFGGLVMTPQPYGPPLLMRPIIYGVSGPTNVMSREEFEAKKEEQRRRLQVEHKPETEHNNGRSSEHISERSGFRAKSEQKRVSRSLSPVERKWKERLSRSRSPTERKWEDSYETSNHKSADQRRFSRSRSPIGRRRGTYNCSPEEMYKRKVPDRGEERVSPINTRQHMQDMPDRRKPREKYSDRYSTDQEEYSERYDSDHETSSRRGMGKIDRWEDRHCQSQQSMPRHYGSHELEEDAATCERSYKNCDNSPYRKTDFQKHRMSLSPQRTSAQSLGRCTKRLDARDYQHDYSDFRRQGSQSAGEARVYQGSSHAQRPQSYDEEYQNGYDTHKDERWRLKEVSDDFKDDNKTVLSRNTGPSSFVGNQQKNRRLKQKACPLAPRKFMTGSVNANAGFMPQENIRTTRSSEPCNYEQVSTSERMPIKSFGQNYQQARSGFYKGREYQDTNEPSENLYKFDNGGQGRDYMRAPRVAQHSDNDFKTENMDEERAYLQAPNPYGAEKTSPAWELKEPSKFRDDRTVLSKRVGPRLVTGNLQKRLQRTRRVNRGLASQFRLMTGNNVENMLAQPNIPPPATNGEPNGAARLSVVVRTNTNGKPQRACRVVTNNASKLNGISRKKRTVEYCGPNRCVVRILDKSKEAKAIRAQKITRRIQMTSNANGNRIVVNAANGAFKQTDERPQNSVFNRISFGIAGPQAVNQVNKRKRNLAHGVFVGRGGKRVKRQC